MRGNSAVPGGPLTSKPTRPNTKRVFGRVGFFFPPGKRAIATIKNEADR
jgi:hypothetical protein